VTVIERVRRLVESGRRQYSAHAVRELAADGILIKPLVDSIDAAVVVEEYPDYHKGPCVLVLQRDETGSPIHLLWGIPKDRDGPAVLVTAYRPQPDQWDAGFRRRKRK
jgi:hypothetical protein